MQKRSVFILLVATLAFAAVLGAVAQQKSDDKAIDPVCGMTVPKAKAAATFDYKGTKYYFCSTGCQEAFAKDPEKYIQPQKSKAADMAIDPVCGMKVSKANAKETYEYKGTTYYFCGPGCKKAFMADPEKYLKNEKSQKEPQDVLMAVSAMKEHVMIREDMPEHMAMKRMGFPMMGRFMGMRPGWPMPWMGGPMRSGVDRLLLRRDVTWTYEKTADGVTLKITSKDPETIKTIQERVSQAKEVKETMAAPAAAGQEQGHCSCPSCPMKEKEAKK